jgi:hypothetical protein
LERGTLPMAMKVEELISGKSQQDSVTVDGLSIPVAALNNLSREGYENLRVYKENRTFSLWGKNRTVCFTLEQIQERAKSE